MRVIIEKNFTFFVPLVSPEAKKEIEELDAKQAGGDVFPKGI